MPQIYKFEVRANVGSQRFSNSIHWRQVSAADAPLSTAAMTDLATKLGDRWSAQIVPFFHTTYSVVAYVVQEITGWEFVLDSQGQPTTKKKVTIARQRLYIPAVIPTGEATGQAMPNTIAMVVNLTTDRFGRRRRGRLKLGPWQEDDSTGNQATTTIVAAVDTALNVILGDVTPIDAPGALTSVIFSQTGLFLEAQPGNVWGQSAVIQDITPSLTWGTQRSRKFGVGAS